MPGFETAITLLENVFFNTNFAGQEWIAYLIFIMASLVIITRLWKDWAALALPILIGWQYFGARIPSVFFVIAGIIFVINTLSTDVITGALSGGINLRRPLEQRRSKAERRAEKIEIAYTKKINKDQALIKLMKERDRRRFEKRKSYTGMSNKDKEKLQNMKDRVRLYRERGLLKEAEENAAKKYLEELMRKRYTKEKEE